MKAIAKKLNEAVKMSFAMGYALHLKMSNDAARKVVLYYHDTPVSEIESFRRQIEYLSKYCRVVKPSEILGAKPDRHKPVVAITFDDSFRSFYENSLPVLKEFNIPAGVFVPVGNLGETPKWDFTRACEDMKQVITDFDEVVQMDLGGFEVYSHSCSHPRLSKLSDQQLDEEIAGSKRILEEMLGHEVYAISYPYGDYDHRVCDAVRKAGYVLGFTIEPFAVNDLTDNLRIGRCEVFPSEGFFKFRLKCCGAFEAVTVLSSLKAVVLKCLHIS